MKNTDVPETGESIGLALITCPEEPAPPKAVLLGDGGRFNRRPKPPTFGDEIGAANVAALIGIVRRDSFGGIGGSGV